MTTTLKNRSNNKNTKTCHLSKSQRSILFQNNPLSIFNPIIALESPTIFHTNHRSLKIFIWIKVGLTFIPLEKGSLYSIHLCTLLSLVCSLPSNLLRSLDKYKINYGKHVVKYSRYTFLKLHAPIFIKLATHLTTSAVSYKWNNGL